MVVVANLAAPGARDMHLDSFISSIEFNFYIAEIALFCILFSWNVLLQCAGSLFWSSGSWFIHTHSCAPYMSDGCIDAVNSHKNSLYSTLSNSIKQYILQYQYQYLLSTLRYWSLEPSVG